VVFNTTTLRTHDFISVIEFFPGTTINTSSQVESTITTIFRTPDINVLDSIGSTSLAIHSPDISIVPVRTTPPDVGSSNIDPSTIEFDGTTPTEIETEFEVIGLFSTIGPI